jgi:predicted nuclease of predicted toxin-antitoxin system
MKIAVDENIPASTVAELREQGHDVLDIRGTADQGMADDAIWQKALAEQRLLITTDKGFAEHRDEAHYGILIVRLNQPTGLKIHHRVMQGLKRYPAWSGLLVVMRDTFQSCWKSRHR